MPHRTAPPARRRLAAVSAVCLGAALLGAASSATAAERPAAPASVTLDASSATVGIHVSSEDAAEAVDFWTPERRAAAIDADAPAPADGTSDSGAVATDAVADSAHATQIEPIPHMGRIFYTQAGKGYACSANVVESANRSTIATAGHCLTQKQVFSDHIVFYPAYDHGESQYGAWPVITGYVPSGWYQRNDDDQGDDSSFMAVKRDDSGQDVQSAVGASPVLFDQPGAEHASAYGYPAAGRFDGESLQWCSGQGEAVSTEQIALPCDMNAGTSGGPILAGDFTDSPQFGNVAERYEDDSHVLGPVWKDVEHSAYDLTAAVAN
ncbi:serine protease [Clavibacter michiganensis subsp. michiganensis]|uniref:trypsin-like serine peptidase n=1 Tax=Clavibacter michiganensis TaxID=28447 RepID=UPI00136613A4|nr:serine protease [Clavibacter michiganensis]MWK62476.1 serine protease [Clavibacter michiganensis subsp. michiganensis]